MDSFITGALAGYGIAIPVGAIAILIVEVGLKHGFRPAFFAGAGAATADFFYAVLAVIGGAALAGVIGDIGRPFEIVSGVVLIVIALVGLRRVGRNVDASDESPYPTRNQLLRIYSRFLGLTLINPTTVVYFAAVIIGLGVAQDMTPSQGALFVVGAFLASLSWQTVVAAVGSSAGQRLSARATSVAIIIGNLVVLAFGILILI
jgi:threonine/homoserine/homoserine lactone efflux protein